MIRIRNKSPCIIFFTVFLAIISSYLQAQIITKQSTSIDEDRFNIRFMTTSFQGTTNSREVTQYILIPQIGLTSRVEFVGWIPFIKVKQDKETQTTLGDMTLDLRFQIKRGWYRFPFFQKEADSRYYLNLYMGFNGATGPKVFEYNGFFFPYSNGIGDFRWGFLFGSYPGNFEYYVNFIYVYAKYAGETFFPVTKDIWNPSATPPAYFFNLHRILLKFLWPGKAYGEYSMIDDYIMYNVSLCYWIDKKPAIFRYKIFTELNGLQNFNAKYCLKKNQLDLTTGVIVRFFKGSKGILGFSAPLIEGEYTGLRFYAGVLFSL